MSNKKGKKQNNYFEQQINRYGDNFLIYKNPAELQMDAIKVFRDLVRGKIDVREYQEYFSNPQFLESCILSASQKFALHNISYNGVNMLVQTMQSQNIPIDQMHTAVLDYHQKASEVYSIILNGLQNYKVTGNIEILIGVVPMTRPFRDYI